MQGRKPRGSGRAPALGANSDWACGNANCGKGQWEPRQGLPGGHQEAGSSERELHRARPHYEASPSAGKGATVPSSSTQQQTRGSVRSLRKCRSTKAGALRNPFCFKSVGFGTAGGKPSYPSGKQQPAPKKGFCTPHPRVGGRLCKVPSLQQINERCLAGNLWAVSACLRLPGCPRKTRGGERWMNI